MKVQQTIKTETIKIAAGSFVLTALMVTVFAIAGKIDATVFGGAIIGWFAAVLDFFLLGLTVQKAARIQAEHPIKVQPENESGSDDETENKQFSDPETAARIKRTIRLSYYGRRLMLLAVAATGLTKYISLLAVIVPMLFPKLVIQLKNLIGLIPKGVGRGE